jgi:hypothetical protein
LPRITPELTKAHAELDRAVEVCYRPQKFHNDRERVEYLFELYEKLSAPLTARPKKGRNGGVGGIGFVPSLDPAYGVSWPHSRQ